jgi:polysaccharide pyruvyl transferase WcaK-like protein
MVGGRMHPAILAAVAGIPVVGVAYNPKFAGVFELLGVPGQWMRVENFVTPGGVGRCADLIARAMDQPASLASSAAALGARTRAWLEEVSGSC